MQPGTHPMAGWRGDRSVDRDEGLLPDERSHDALPEADAHLLRQLRGGDATAGGRFVRDHYAGVYRYLLYLTGHRETAEDLTQETFLQAWRHLDQFQGRAPLRIWLHTIARREFLQAKRRQRAVISLDEAAECPEPHASLWTDEAELRVLLSRLPADQQEIMLLSCLEGYSSQEIAQIVQIPARTVRHRLEMARGHLAQAFGPGDLAYLNEPTTPMRQWAWLPLEERSALETRLTIGGVRRWALGVGTEPRTPNAQHPTPDAPSEARREEPMERREFIRCAAVGAAGLMLPEAEKELVDSRLTQKVTCAFKATALSDLCERLRADTGVHLVAGNSVADEKVTLFCQKLPLRDVMRQLSRPFGYAWLRSGAPGELKYELAQDLKSQLLEEELRNRDRNEALLALDREMELYRLLLTLSPDEALARARSAAPEDRKRLEHLSGPGWAPIQMYFRLSPQEQAALRAGQELEFRQEPPSDAAAPDTTRTLPADIARGILQARRELRIVPKERDSGGVGQDQDGEKFRFARENEPGGLPPSAVPTARAAVSLSLDQTELGRFGFNGSSTVSVAGSHSGSGTGPYAVGFDPTAAQPDNARLNARLAADPALRRRVTLQPKPSCHLVPSEDSTSTPNAERPTPNAQPRLTTADVLEALHQATGMPIIADFYTRLYAPEAVSVTNQTLFEALNHLSDAMRLRWQKEASTGRDWLQCRSMSFYIDRPKEVPNRLLTRWAAARREHGSLRLDELVEIAGLPDPALDAREMAEGARACWSLAEWDLACNDALRPHLRWIAGFDPLKRQKLQRAPGLPFPELSVAQQQQFMALAIGPDPKAIDSLAELETAAMQVDYSLPGGFEWKGPEPDGRPRGPLTPVRAATREAALAAAHRLDPQAAPAQVQPTQRRLVLLYWWGTPEAHGNLQISTTRRGDTSIGRGRSVNRP
jgi:RNA polymerase sigma-70 factor, ECF subfamily